MTTGITPHVDRADGWRMAAVVVGGCFVGAYAIVALSRMAYPFQIEWLEGVVLDHVHRVTSGQAVYVSPSAEFVPTMYTPGYYYASALVARVVGESFAALRLVSFLSSLAIMVMIFRTVRAETASPTVAWISASLFAAMYRPAGFWFDVGRPDSLYVALWLAAAVRVRFAARPVHDVSAGLLLAAAILTKQIALLPALPLFWWAFRAGRARGVRLLGTTAACTAIVAIALEWTSGGWFSFYVATGTGLDLPSLPRIITWMLVPLPVVWSAALWLARECRKFATRPPGISYWVAVTWGGIATYACVGLQRGTAQNALMPLLAALAILAGLALQRALARSMRRDSRVTPRRAYVFAVAQFVMLAYVPWRQVPSAQDVAGNERLAAVVRDAAGPVFVYDQGFLPRLVGKSGHATRSPVELLHGDLGGQVRAEIARAICDGRYDAVILRADEGDQFTRELRARYERPVAILRDADVPRAITVDAPNPNMLYRLRPTPSPGGGCGSVR